MIRIFITIDYILLDYIVGENLNLNVSLLRSNALFLWRQEDMYVCIYVSMYVREYPLSPGEGFRAILFL